METQTERQGDSVPDSGDIRHNPIVAVDAVRAALAARNYPIAIDAMGGDDAPATVVEGAVAAARAYQAPIVLVGVRAAIERELARHDVAGLDIEILETDEVIGSGESPVHALRHKPRASLKLAVDLVTEGRVSAAYSCGNSGALMAAGLFALHRIPGVDRPAFGTTLPTRTGATFLVDMGANPECKPAYLLQFAAMGVAYMRLARGIANPSVGLLSIGEEAEKGSSLVREAHELLRASAFNFVGNIEGNDVPAGAVDVVVADGFSGNVLLKTAEGTASTIAGLLRSELRSSLRTKIGAALAMPALRRLAQRINFEEYGGAPVLGVRGLVIKGHGRSGPLAIRNGVRVARDLAQQDLVAAITVELEKLKTHRPAGDL